MQTPEYDNLEKHLLDQIKSGKKFFWNQLRWDAVKEYFKLSQKILDFGAGPGLLGEFIEDEFPNNTYFFSEKIESLRIRLISKYGEDKDYTNLNQYHDFDVICMLDVLEHIENDQEFLIKLTQEMKSGSKLIITVPAKMSLWSAWDKKHGHFRRYEKQSLKDLFLDLNGTIKECSYLFPELFPVALNRKRKLNEFDLSRISDEDLNFPDWPKWLNGLIRACLTPSLKLRRISPIGTSLILVWVRA